MAEITIRISDKALKIATIVVFVAIATYVFLPFLRLSRILIPSYRLLAYVPEAEGVTAGSPVLLSGIEVGTVDKVNLAEGSADTQRKIELTLRIAKRYQDMIRTDSKATFITQGLLGGRGVEIQPGYSGVPIKTSEEVPFVPQRQLTGIDIAELLKKFGDCQKQETQSPKPASR